MTTTDMMSTWKDTIQFREYEKKNLPWNPTEVVPVSRVSLYERKRQEREFDPITMKYRDESKEAMLQSMRSEQLNKTLMSTTDRLKKSFNIVNHEGPPRKVDMMENPRKTKTRDFNFLTNMGWDDHKETPLLYDEDYNIEKIKSLRSNRPATTHVKVRDFNMINNDYYEDPVGRKQREDAQLKETLTKKFWDTHSYDPVKAQYYDQLREEQYQQQRQVVTQVHGTNSTLKLPPSIQFSDGNSYNILNHGVYDDQRLKATRIMEDRSLNRIKRREVEANISQVGAIKNDIDEERKLNRASFKRWEQQQDRGYNILNNSIALDAPSPHPSRPPSMWSRLNTAQSSVRASTGNMDVLALSRELAPTGRTRNLSGVGLPSGRDIVEFASSSSANNNGAAERSGLRTAPQNPSSSRGLEKYESFLSSATELPNIANNHFSDSARNNKSNQKSINNLANAGSELPRGNSRQNVPTMEFLSSRQGAREPARGGAIPSLDLTRTEFAEKVTYTEPLTGGAKGQPVAMVRTGGLSSYRNN